MVPNMASTKRTHETEPEFWTIPAAARRLGIGGRVLRGGIDSGGIPVYRVGSWPRVRLAEVRHWIEAQRVPITNHARARVDELLKRERS